MRCEDEARRSNHSGKTSCLLAPDKLVLVTDSCDFYSAFFFNPLFYVPLKRGFYMLIFASLSVLQICQ